MTCISSMASARLGLIEKPSQLQSVVDSPFDTLRSSQTRGASRASAALTSTMSLQSQGLCLSVAQSPCNGKALTSVRPNARRSIACTPFLGSVLRFRSPPCAFPPPSRTNTTRVSASAAQGGASMPSEAPTPAPAQSELVKTIRLGALFGLWYLFNIYFNIYNKQVLKVFPYAITCTLIQFAVGATFTVIMWATGIYKRPAISASMLKGIIPLAIVHTLGNMFTNLSLGKVAVSFTHTIKAMEPAFSVLLSALFLGDKPQPIVILSLLPIMGGVALASATEASFNWAGFLSAMSSNLTFQSRNVLSKKLMLKKEGSMDNIQLFSVITVLSFFILLIPCILVEGVKFTPAYLQASGVNVNEVITRALLAGLCFHAYQQVSYMILQVVSPVTHSVGNCVKRVVVIVSSVIFFRTPVSLLNGVGTSLALAGVFAYSRIKASSSKKKSE